MRKTLVFGSVAATALGLALTAAPANAGTGDTVVTFNVGTVGSTVSIVAGPYVPGTGATDVIDGTITSIVTDLRTGGGSWTDAVSSTNFNLVGATTPAGTSQIPVANAKIWTPTTTVAILGTSTVTNTHSALVSALTLGTSAVTLVSATTTNVNTVTLVSNLQIDTAGKASGQYTGTITQTVS